jgi:uncharacterized protein YprB with RNaseH-like and TPR domain
MSPPDCAAHAGDGSTLAQRIARLALRHGDRRAPPDRAQAVATLVERSGATCIAPELLRVERDIELPMPADWRLPLDRTRTLALPAASAVLLDTETTGLAGGSGTFAFVVGCAAAGPDEVGTPSRLRVVQWLATTWAAEGALLDAVRDAVADAGALVTWNGRSYDVPLLRTRCVLRRRPDPFADLPHADLLHATRRWLADPDWIDCRLVTAAARLNGMTRIDDLPGAEAPAAWQRWLVQGDADGLVRVLDHNCADLVALAGIARSCDRWWRTLELRARRTSGRRRGLAAVTPSLAERSA